MGRDDKNKYTMNITEEELQREKWVEDYNKSLPQVKTYLEEFETEISIGVGGIYDSEYMNYVFDNIESPRIKEIKKQKNRLNVVSNWAMFLLTLHRSGKGQKTRREWLCYIQQGARTVFNTEQDEYEYIGKFGRGRWSKEFLEKGFSQDEINMIVDFAKEYGAFDY